MGVSTWALLVCVWELLSGNVRLGALGREFQVRFVGMFVGSFRLGLFVWELLVGSFVLGTFGMCLGVIG